MVKVFLFGREERTTAMRGPLRIAARLAACILLTLTMPASATTFGDIDVNVASEPKGVSWHGYFEYAIVVTNHSADQSHTVSVAMPHEKQIMHDDYIRECGHGAGGCERNRARRPFPAGLSPRRWLGFDCHHRR